MKSKHVSKPLLFAILAMLAILVFEQAFENTQRSHMEAHAREHALYELVGFRARLEGVLNGNILMTHGLSAAISVTPDLDQQVFEQIASNMLDDSHPVRNFAAAPDMVIRYVYPIEGNEAAIGLDYRSHPTQKDQALPAIKKRQIVVAGPLHLVQGGDAIVAREPVYVRDASGQESLWGLVSTVFDMDKLWQMAGLNEIESTLDIAIRGRHGLGAEGEVFHGDPALFEQNPILSEVSLPDGTWQIAAQPHQGWPAYQGSELILFSRMIAVAASLLVGLLVYNLMRNHERLQQSSAELRESEALFNSFMQNLPAGAFIKKPGQQGYVYQNPWMEKNDAPESSFSRDGMRPELQQVQQDTITLAPAEPKGQKRHYQLLRFPISSDKAEHLFGGIVQDVSEQRNAELDLAASQARLRALLDTIPDLVWLKDPDGTYLACNKRFEAFFGATEAEIVGKSDHDFVDTELADFFRQHDLAAINAGEPTMNEEKVAFANDGHEELLETIKSPVRTPDGILMGVLGIARDITERASMAMELKNKVEELTRWQNVILGRETRILELKREINTLHVHLGDEPPYPSVREE